MTDDQFKSCDEELRFGAVDEELKRASAAIDEICEALSEDIGNIGRHLMEACGRMAEITDELRKLKGGDAE